MTKRTAVSYIYFAVVLMTLLLRVSSSLDVYSSLGVDNVDAYFTCVVQMLIFGAMSVGLYFLAVTRNECGGLLSLARDFGVKGVDGKSALMVAALGVCMTVVGAGFSFMWQIVLQMIGYTHVPSSTDYYSVAVLLEELILTALLPAVFEEIAHRGLIYAGYRETGWKFVIISALTFSLMHQNIVQTGYTFVDGAIMALAMYYTGSIFPGIYMHFLNNAWSVFSGYVAQNGGAFNFINVIDDFLSSTPLGLAVSAFLFVLFAGLAVLLILGLRRVAVKSGRIPPQPFYTPPEGVVKPLRYDVGMLCTIAVGVVATIFSFAWGMAR